jgi:hypothetical protein
MVDFLHPSEHRCSSAYLSALRVSALAFVFAVPFTTRLLNYALNSRSEKNANAR